MQVQVGKHKEQCTSGLLLPAAWRARGMSGWQNPGESDRQAQLQRSDDLTQWIKVAARWKTGSHLEARWQGGWLMRLKQVGSCHREQGEERKRAGLQRHDQRHPPLVGSDNAFFAIIRYFRPIMIPLAKISYNDIPKNPQILERFFMGLYDQFKNAYGSEKD